MTGRGRVSAGSVPRPTTADRVYDRLKRDILTCALHPGAVVNEVHLSAALGVSKTPVREALAMLVDEGFVVVEPRRGYRVRDITLADVQEIFHLRAVLEPGAAAFAARRHDATDVRSLQRMAATATSATPFGTADRAFHAALADASGNVRLARLLHRLLEEVYRLHMTGLVIADRPAPRLHQDLVAAIGLGDADRAHDIAARQVELDRTLVMDALAIALTSGSTPGVRVGIVPH
jgi:DNA-binding GntR family transcriptional regulator